jgi:hypothetical protein
MSVYNPALDRLDAIQEARLACICMCVCVYVCMYTYTYTYYICLYNPALDRLDAIQEARLAGELQAVEERLAEASTDNAQLALRLEQVEGAFLLCVVN